MRSTERWPSLEPTPDRPPDRFDDLRSAYFARLRSDLVQLTRLRAAFDDPAVGRAALAEDVRRAAHGMAGAAAMFEAFSVATAACALEDAACAVKAAPASIDALRASLDELMRVLQRLGA